MGGRRWSDLFARRSIRWLCALFVAAVLVPGGYVAAQLATGNFHAVVPGVLYRSAQPTADEIARYHAAYGIRTIVNLRGANPGESWYREEAVEAKRLGIKLIDFRMSARRELTQARAAELIDTLKAAEGPILVHCSAGADRSGLAAALYLAAVAGKGEEAAEAQLSLRYGHIAFPLVASYAMDETFEALEPWLGFGNS